MADVLFDPRKTSNINRNNLSNLNSQALEILVHLIAATGLEQELLKILTTSNINSLDSDGDTPLNYAIFTVSLLFEISYIFRHKQVQFDYS